MPNILSNIPIILVVFIILLGLLNFAIRRNNKAQADVEAAFFERERQANNTRKQDISNLPYISIPDGIIPQNPCSAAAQKICALSESRILNLIGKSNTDLKLEYGVANLEALSEYDNNYTELVTSLNTYSDELYQAGQIDEATAVLEYAVSIQADIKAIYIRLAKLYSESGQSHRIPELIQQAEQLNTLSKDSILRELKTYLP